MTDKFNAQTIPQIQKDKYNLMPHELNDLRGINDKAEAILYLSSMVAMENNLTEMSPHEFIDDKAKNELSLIQPYLYGQNTVRDRAKRLRDRLGGMGALPFPDETILHLGDSQAHDVAVPDLSCVVSFSYQTWYDPNTVGITFVSVAMDARADSPNVAGELRNSASMINPTGYFICLGKKSLSIKATQGVYVSIHFWRENFI